MSATRALIHLDALRHNAAFARSLTGAGAVMASVKADAYGHGAVAVARALLEAGISHLGTARAGEAVSLRENGIKAPILVFSIPYPDEIATLAAYNISCFVPDIPYAAVCNRHAERERKPLSVHIKIDTGMGRIGCAPENAPELAQFIARQPFLHLDGIGTHLAVADSRSPEDIAYTRRQIALFAETVNTIRKSVDPGLVHAAASGGILRYPESYFDMVRPGILLYGYTPDNDMAEKISLRPVMELVTRISFLKKVRKGESISYGRNWIAGQDTVVATLPAGYADGLPRAASGKLWFVVNGKRCPQIGAICMDQCMVDIGNDSPARLWDEVTLFGGTSGAPTAASVAEAAGTISYEILCGIGGRVPRVYIPR
jgi:alanine racemase